MVLSICRLIHRKEFYVLLIATEILYRRIGFFLLGEFQIYHYLYGLERWRIEKVFY